MSNQSNRLTHVDTELTVQGNHPFKLEGNQLVESKIAKDLQPDQLELLVKIEQQIERLRRLIDE